MSLCILPQPKDPYGFTITQAVTESWRNNISNSQQIIIVGLDTLHRQQLQTSVIILLMDTMISFQESYVQPDMHLHFNSMSQHEQMHSNLVNQESSKWISMINSQTNNRSHTLFIVLLKRSQRIKTQHLQSGFIVSIEQHTSVLPLHFLKSV